jgi:hypothetical protein
VGRPIESKNLDTIALAGTMLATIGAKGRTEHINVVQVLSTGEKLGIPIATVEEMRAWEQSPLG